MTLNLANAAEAGWCGMGSMDGMKFRDYEYLALRKTHEGQTKTHGNQISQGWRWHASGLRQRLRYKRHALLASILGRDDLGLVDQKKVPLHRRKVGGVVVCQ